MASDTAQHRSVELPGAPASPGGARRFLRRLLEQAGQAMSPDALDEGERLPPRFREAHVAGFSRHLRTGDARAIGADLVLPVLRADGSEVSCTFLIESHPAPRGRQVYVAWIAPLREGTT